MSIRVGLYPWKVPGITAFFKIFGSFYGNLLDFSQNSDQNNQTLIILQLYWDLHLKISIENCLFNQFFRFSRKFAILYSIAN